MSIVARNVSNGGGQPEVLAPQEPQEPQVPQIQPDQAA